MGPGVQIPPSPQDYRHWSPSARWHPSPKRISASFTQVGILPSVFGKMAERFNAFAWRANTPDGVGGSNPSFTAKENYSRGLRGRFAKALGPKGCVGSNPTFSAWLHRSTEGQLSSKEFMGVRITLELQIKII